MLLRARARQQKQPVVGISAHHEGISHAEGQKLDDERFSGLARHLELAEEARVIITHNLHVEFGLMNGARGTVKGILFAPGASPVHHDRALRMPLCILVDCPKYQGPPFFSEPERRTWVPIFSEDRARSAGKGLHARNSRSSSAGRTHTLEGTGYDS